MSAFAACVLAFATAAQAAPPSDRLLSSLKPGWELDRVGESGQTSMPRLAWSRDARTVVYAARSGSRLELAVNARVQPADEVGLLSLTPDGLSPVYSYSRSAKTWLTVGDKTFGPYDAVDRPALSSDGTRAAFQAVLDSERLEVVDGTVAARGGFLSEPVLDPRGRAAWWSSAQGRWTLWWDGKPAPGTPFPAPGSDPAEVGAPVFSPDGSRVAFKRRDADGRVRVVVDGRAGEPFLDAGEPFFSPDSRTLAYAAASGPEYDLDTVVEGGRAVSALTPAAPPGGKPPGPIAIGYVWGARYLRDGRLMYFAQLLDGKTCFVLGGSPSAEFPSAVEPAFDPGFRRAGFIARGDRDARAVIDGVPGPLYDAVEYLQFDPSGRHWAYTAHQDSAAFVVADGVPGPRFDTVGWVRFSQDGGTLAYWASRGGRWYTVINGRRAPAAASADLIGDLILGGPRARIPIFTAREDGAWYLYVDGDRHGPYDSIGALHYDAAAGAVVAGTREGRDFRRRVIPLEWRRAGGKS